MVQQFVEWACGHTTVAEEHHDSTECEIRRLDRLMRGLAGAQRLDHVWAMPPPLASPSATPSSESPESGSSDHPRPRKAGERSR
jgi:hypothetical protein